MTDRYNDNETEGQPSQDYCRHDDIEDEHCRDCGATTVVTVNAAEDDDVSHGA